MLSTILFSLFLSLPVIIFTMTIIYNMPITNNYDARHQYPILLPKIPMGTRKDFSENYGQFGPALSKRFVTLVLQRLMDSASCS
jgi:hypothetical protein